MNINLPEHQEEFINQQVIEGGYRSVDEWLQEIIYDRMLQVNPALKAELDASLDRGLADIEAGRTKPLGEVMERIKAEIRTKFDLA